MQGPSHLGRALRGAVGFPQLFDAGHLGYGELASGQAHRHVEHDGCVLHLSSMGVLEVHEGDTPAVREAPFLFVLLRISHALGGGLLNQQQRLPSEIAICVVLAWGLQFMHIAVEKERKKGISLRNCDLPVEQMGLVCVLWYGMLL